MQAFEQAALSRIRRITCAIGVLKVSVDDYCKDPTDPKFKIFGTGFLIAPLLVITNRHVLTSLSAFLEKESLPKNRRHVAFMRPDGAGIAQSFHEFDKMAAITNPHFDVGLIAFQATEADPIREVDPAQVSASASYEVGDPVGVYGYAFGEGLLKREFGERERIYRFGPVLQKGYISGLSPYDHSGLVDRMLLDVRTAKGMSGAPVFNPQTGAVYALHSSGIEDTVAFAIPINSQMVETFAEMARIGSPGDSGESTLQVVSRNTDILSASSDGA
jgi:hypothetical protein